MASKRGVKKSRMGALPPRYSFVLNPHADLRFTRCPKCEGHTRIRKLPLVIHVDDAGLLVVGKTCRLCVACEILIAHEADVGRLIAALTLGAEKGQPEYLVLGTVEPHVWRRGLHGSVSIDEVIEYMADFKTYLQVDFTPGGWYPKIDRLANALQPTAGKRRTEYKNGRRAGRG